MGKPKTCLVTTPIIKRKCKYCKGKLTVKADAFNFRRKIYALPYCAKCNTIFEEDMLPIMRDEMAKVYELGEPY